MAILEIRAEHREDADWNIFVTEESEGGPFTYWWGTVDDCETEAEAIEEVKKSEEWNSQVFPMQCSHGQPVDDCAACFNADRRKQIPWCDRFTVETVPFLSKLGANE